MSDVLSSLPPPEALALAGMAVVGFYGLWTVRIVPYLARRRAHAPTA